MFTSLRVVALTCAVLLNLNPPIPAAEKTCLVATKFSWHWSREHGWVEYFIDDISMGKGDDGLARAAAKLADANPCFVLIVSDPESLALPKAGETASTALKSALGTRPIGRLAQPGEDMSVLLYDEESEQLWLDGKKASAKSVLQQIESLGIRGGLFCTITRVELSMKARPFKFPQWHELSERLESAEKIRVRAFRVYATP